MIIALTIFAVAITTLVLVFVIECAAALAPQRTKRSPDDTPRPPLAVLVPAHNEEAGIVATLTLLKRQLAPHDELLVIADNCTDRTAEIARGMGAIVLERTSDTDRGKGFAMQAGLAELRTRSVPPAVVLLFDADCQPQAGCLQELARTALATDRPVQGKYLMVRPAGATPRQLVSEFAVTVKNFVRLRGLHRLGLPSLLTGSGIALPWRIATTLPLAGGHIVEDMQLTFDLLMRGENPTFCEQAVVISSLPTGAKSSGIQRTRWEHGHLQVLTHMAPRLAWEAVKQLRPTLALMALDLAVPPLSLLVLAWFATWLIAFPSALSGSPEPWLLLTCAGLAMVAAVLASWWRFARQDVPLTGLLTAPLYAAAKAPMYARYLVRRERRWIRTDRS